MKHVILSSQFRLTPEWCPLGRAALSFGSAYHLLAFILFTTRILGTSGQNVNDIFRMSAFEERLDILDQNMVWSHIAPTAPDTLGEPIFYSNSWWEINWCGWTTMCQDTKIQQTKWHDNMAVYHTVLGNCGGWVSFHKGLCPVLCSLLTQISDHF